MSFCQTCSDKKGLTKSLDFDITSGIGSEPLEMKAKGEGEARNLKFIG